jgi:hypothetical protein
MKKILFPTLALILAACAPALTLPATPHLTPATPHLTPETPTPIPTPTVHPQFLSLQDQIAASGETFTLNQNGQIEMRTEEGMTIVPDIQVHPDGTVTFTHDGQTYSADPQTITIEGRTITFKDENGKTWVFDGESLQSEAIAQAKADFEKYGYDHSALTFSENEEGKVIATDPETGEVVYEDGKFALRYAVENVTDLMPTNYEPSSLHPGQYRPGSKELVSLRQ